MLAAACSQCRCSGCARHVPVGHARLQAVLLQCKCGLHAFTLDRLRRRSLQEASTKLHAPRLSPPGAPRWPQRSCRRCWPTWSCPSQVALTRHWQLLPPACPAAPPAARAARAPRAPAAAPPPQAPAAPGMTLTTMMRHPPEGCGQPAGRRQAGGRAAGGRRAHAQRARTRTRTRRRPTITRAQPATTWSSGSCS